MEGGEGCTSSACCPAHCHHHVTMVVGIRGEVSLKYIYKGGRYIPRLSSSWEVLAVVIMSPWWWWALGVGWVRNIYSRQQNPYNVLYFWKDMSIVHEGNILNSWKYYGRHFNIIPKHQHSHKFPHPYLVGLSHDTKWQLIVRVLLPTFLIMKNRS